MNQNPLSSHPDPANPDGAFFSPQLPADAFQPIETMPGYVAAGAPPFMPQPPQPPQQPVTQMRPMAPPPFAPPPAPGTLASGVSPGVTPPTGRPAPQMAPQRPQATPAFPEYAPPVAPQPAPQMAPQPAIFTNPPQVINHQPAFTPPAPAASPVAIAAVQEAPRNEIFKLHTPIEVSGVRYEHFTIKRLKWAAFEKALFYARERSEKTGATASSIMMADIAGVPTDVINELDWEDGVRLLEVIGQLYPLDRLVSAPPTT